MDEDDFDPYDNDDLDFSDDGFESIDESPKERSTTDSTVDKKADKPSSSGVVTGVKHLLELKKTLELDSFKEKKSNRKERKKRQKERKRLQKKGLTGQKSEPVVQTLATKLSGKAFAPPEVVVFDDARKRSRQRKELVAAKNSANHQVENLPKVKLDDDTAELSMKQARFEVFKFSLSGMDKTNQMEARVAQAIRLGAKAPKKTCMSLNDLKNKRKQEQEEARQQKEMQRVTGMVTSSRSTSSTKGASSGKGVDKKKSDKKSSSSSKSKKKGGQSIALKMGKFDGGMLKLSAKDLAKIKQ